jgi:hypothetical protein
MSIKADWYRMAFNIDSNKRLSRTTWNDNSFETGGGIGDHGG